MKFKIQIYFDSKVVKGILEVDTKYHSKEIIRKIMQCGALDKAEELKETPK